MFQLKLRSLKSTGQRIAILLSISLLSVFAFSSLAMALTPSETITSTVAEVKQVISTEKGKISPEELNQKLRQIIVPVFDFKAMARGSLAQHWKKATPEEQEEFTKLFGDLLGETYLKKIRDNIAESDLSIQSEKIKGKKAIVKTNISTGDDAVNLDYRMRSKNDNWLIYDVVIENIGLVSNYRSEFTSIVKRSGVAGVIEKLKEKKAKAENTETSFNELREGKHTVVAQLILEAS